jgi:hypothetical protein
LSFRDTIQRWVAEPAPDYVFEISEYGLAQASPRTLGPPRVETSLERSLAPSPSSPNVLRAQWYREVVARFAASQGQRRQTVALVIPDYAVRMSILDFQDFPASETDRMALLRFRLRKSVQFHIEEAQLSYAIQNEEAKNVEVLAVAIARPILEEYESLFVEQGLCVGLVTPSLLAALPLFRNAGTNGLTLIAKTSATTVSVLLTGGGRLRLIRSLDLSLGEEESSMNTADAVLPLIQQTLAFAEDQIGIKVDKILLCGFGEESRRIAAVSEREYEIPATVIRSKFGDVTQQDAGLLGMLEQYAA